MKGPWDPVPAGKPQPSPVSLVLPPVLGWAGPLQRLYGILPRGWHGNLFPFISKSKGIAKKVMLEFSLLEHSPVWISSDSLKKKKQQTKTTTKEEEKSSSSKEWLTSWPRTAILRLKEEGESHTETIKLKRHHPKTWSQNETFLKTYPLTIHIAKQFLSLHHTPSGGWGGGVGSYLSP